MKKSIMLSVNNEKHEVLISPSNTLLDVLREKLKIKGPKEACGVGACGACTVLVDGKPVNACIVLALEVEGKEIETIEGLSIEGRLHPLQEAFIDHHAVQCGYCTPGMIMAAKALLERNFDPTEDDIKNAIGGNICRCTGYENITDAIMSVSKKGSQEGETNA